MNEQVLLLSKKHGQLKQATTKMVQTVMGFLDDTPNLETKLSVIETLRTVTEGKVRSIEASKHVNTQLTDITQRSSLKSSAPVSHGYYQTSRRSKVRSMRLPTFFASSRSRHSVP
jgi:hypothetical protein